jgi:hypothetical protein
MKAQTLEFSIESGQESVRICLDIRLINQILFLEIHPRDPHAFRFSMIFEAVGVIGMNRR